jgi:ribosomal protein S18 acetylase RimI-like enzyme
VSISVRNAELADVADIVRVHQQAFRGFLLTDLGPRFLSNLYTGFITIPGGALIIAESADGKVAGLLAAASKPSDFFRILRRHRGVSMAISAVPGLLRHPIRVGERLLSSLFYRGDQPAELPGYWLLSSLGVVPDVGSKGYARALMAYFLDSCHRAGANGVYLFTDQNNNEVALKFYANQKFEACAIKSRRSGRRLVLMVRKFPQ